MLTVSVPSELSVCRTEIYYFKRSLQKKKKNQELNCRMMFFQHTIAPLDSGAETELQCLFPNSSDPGSADLLLQKHAS